MRGALSVTYCPIHEKWTNPENRPWISINYTNWRFIVAAEKGLDLFYGSEIKQVPG